MKTSAKFFNLPADIQIVSDEAVLSEVLDAKIKFTDANTKTKKLRDVPSLWPYLTRGRQIYGFSLPSGMTCPAAVLCLGKAVKTAAGSWRIIDGIYQQFRCFSAMDEVRQPSVRKNRMGNYVALLACKTAEEMADIIEAGLPEDAGIVRIHIGGDFFSRIYFRAWLIVAARRPDILFYGYTKFLVAWIDELETVNSLPNLVLTASRGGAYDDLIERHNLREAIVLIASDDEAEAEAAAMGLDLDHDDSHAANPMKRNQSFCLAIHGSQKAGTEAALIVDRTNKAKAKAKKMAVMS